jgi:hypothetical protein
LGGGGGGIQECGLQEDSWSKGEKSFSLTIFKAAQSKTNTLRLKFVSEILFQKILPLYQDL